jgi:hypothetical protein
MFWVNYNNLYNFIYTDNFMEIIHGERFRKSIQDNLKKIPRETGEDFLKINKIFSESQIYVLGGFVRDSILQVLYNYKSPMNDLDILIDDDHFGVKINAFSKKDFSRFGGLKFKYSNFSMDVFGMNNISFLKQNPYLRKNIENVLRGCDISTSALAYDTNKKEIYNIWAMEDILRKEVNLNDQDYLRIGPSISRLILHADKMGFKIGERGIDYIKRNYSSKIDKEILDYLKYKNIEHLFPLIKNFVNSI